MRYGAHRLSLEWIAAGNATRILSSRRHGVGVTGCKAFLFFDGRGERRLQGRDFSTGCRGNSLDLFLFRLLGFPIASLLTLCHVDLLWVRDD